jgi:hypothetical protein
MTGILQDKGNSPPFANRGSNANDRVRVNATIIRGAPDGWFKPGNGKKE